ncbi:TonB-dependent siderophore receptor [Halomonas sp. CUBES01]|uniref:TonB-dependent siderophore receptor n=1 Tax=Vreelandella gomseomensis TaxID=370766 RepID=A0ABU1G7C8_9GAMM|nr:MULTISPECIES: TonB-dependent siderophore receptor [Halomonas]MDR5873393.1 TonB-dependent siderophore receptor [Halomonas gomseomensis]MEC4768151.1 TonB-dependent siderophore receptor [Halomonas sp. CUBES01]
MNQPIFRKRWLTTAIAVAACSSSAFAQEADQDSSDLPVVRVVGEAISEPSTENTGSYTSNRVTIGKQEQSLKEIPQSVSVITRERMNDQNMTTLGDVMSQTTGITKSGFGPSASIFRSRGFDIDTLLLDGSPIDTAAGVTDTIFDTAVLDRVEVLRGPSGLLQGSGEPSGTVNLVRKRAKQDFGFQSSLSYGSWDTYRGEVDITGALDESGRLRGRFVGVYDDKGSFIDHIYDEHTLGYGTLEYDLTPNTTLSAGIMSQSGESRPNFGLPQLSNGELLSIDRSTYHGSLWDIKDENLDRYFVELEHQLDNGGNLRLIANYIERETDTQQSSAGVSFPDTNTDAIDIAQWRIITPREDSFVDATVSTPFTFLGETHNIMAGASYKVTEEQVNWSYGNPQNIQRSLVNPDPNTPKPTFDINQTTNSKTEETGVYSQLNLSVLENTTLVAGGRVSWWEVKDRLNSSNNFDIDGELTPYAGLIYDINKDISAYASYTDIFKPQSSQNIDGEFLDPRTGEQFELGLKGNSPNGLLNWHAAAFRIIDQNRSVTDIENPGFSVSDGEVESKGLELEITGQPLPRLDISAGYAYTLTEYLKDPVQQGRDFSTETPEHNLKLWSRYQFSDDPDTGWRIGAGVNYISSIYVEAGDQSWDQSGYTLLSGLIGYRFNRHLDFSLKGNNLTDKKYFDSLRARSRNNHYGEPRNFTLTMRYQY